MNKDEAKKIITSELDQYRAKPYSELVRMIDCEPVTKEHHGSSGQWYQIEVEAFWDDKPNENIRVIGSIDDGGWRAYCPLNSDFIKSPSDQFVGE